jgi:hypothetical protein
VTYRCPNRCDVCGPECYREQRDELPADRYAFAMPKDPREEKPGLSPQLVRNLAIYIALILAVVVACGVSR